MTRVTKILVEEKFTLKSSKSDCFKIEEDWLVHYLAESGVTLKLTEAEFISKISLFHGSINQLSIFIPNAASLLESFVPLLLEENQRQKWKKRSVKKFDLMDESTVLFKNTKAVYANTSNTHNYDSTKDTTTNFKQKTEGRDWVPFSFACS